jgi:hypothetical protein
VAILLEALANKNGIREVDNICIISDFSIAHDSYSSLGYSYQYPDYEKDTDKAENILAGSHFFETVEIEVYGKSN